MLQGLLAKVQHALLNTRKRDVGREFLQGNFAPVHEEVRKEHLPVVGRIPPYLHGTYVRNGPNPFAPAPKSYHWFDGEGMVHACFLNGLRNEAHYENRALVKPRTPGGVLPIGLGTLMGMQGVGMLLLDALWGRLPKARTANTSVVVFGKKVLALNEEDVPVELSVGEKGQVRVGERMEVWDMRSMTAHPKVDPVTREMFVINYSLLERPHVQVACFTEAMQKTWEVDVELPAPIMMHDFGLTRSYVVLLDFPLRFVPERMGDGALPLHFDPWKPARIGLLPRHGTAENIQWFPLPYAHGCFHVINAYEDAGRVHVFVCAYDRVDMDFTHTPEHLPKICRYTVDVERGLVTCWEFPEAIGVEFPSIHPAYVGRKGRYAFVARMSRDHAVPMFQGVLKVDLWEGKAVGEIMYPVGVWGGEAHYVPCPFSNEEDDGVLLVYTYREVDEVSELRIYDAYTMKSEPLAVVTLPQRVPFGFHGTFVPRL